MLAYLPDSNVVLTPTKADCFISIKRYYVFSKKCTEWDTFDVMH